MENHRHARLLTALLALAAAAPALSEDIRIESIFGPERPGKYKHPACAEELDNGDLLLVYHAGGAEYADDTAVWGARRRSGAAQWEEPRVIADTPFHGDGNAVVWQAPDGVVWLFSVVRYGPTWSESRSQARLSRDRGERWSDPFFLSLEPGRMVRNKPIVLNDGSYLLPAYHEVGGDPERVPSGCASVFFRFEPRMEKGEKRWREIGRIVSDRGNIQPAVAQLGDGRLVAYCRRGGDYNPTTNGWIVRAESRDNGRTWSEGKDCEFRNPNAAVDLIRLRNGHLMLVFNDSMDERTPLSAAISTDDDKTWPASQRRAIASGPGDFAYPVALESHDGRLMVVFTAEERSVIRLATFEESAILRAAK